MRKLAEIILASAMMGGDLPKIKVPVKKNFGKPLKDHRIPPRSMTPAERDWYAIHKNLNGFYN